MRAIKVRLRKRSYDILIGRGVIKYLGRYLDKLDIGKDAYIITNAAVKKSCAQALVKALNKAGYSIRFKLVPDTEKSKSLKIVSSVISDIARFDKKRRVFIIALGGGVIGDLSGFIASIYKRGVPYIQIPTTILAQVDSAIGGKTAVDLSEGKNLAGAFYQPRLVLSEISFLKTLSLRQARSGLAEAIKYGILKDKILFNFIERHYRDILALKQPALEHVIERASRIKADIVSKDEREEKGVRTILNLGHTVGHAIEKAAHFKKYNHGEAVALGILAALDISRALGFCSEKTAKRIENIIVKSGLPSKIKGIPQRAIINAHYHDKKFVGGKNRLVLIKDIGKVAVRENIPLETIRKAIKKIA